MTTSCSLYACSSQVLASNSFAKPFSPGLAKRSRSGKKYCFLKYPNTAFISVPFLSGFRPIFCSAPSLLPVNLVTCFALFAINGWTHFFFELLLHCLSQHKFYVVRRICITPYLRQVPSTRYIISFRCSNNHLPHPRNHPVYHTLCSHFLSPVQYPTRQAIITMLLKAYAYKYHL